MTKIPAATLQAVCDSMRGSKSYIECKEEGVLCIERWYAPGTVMIYRLGPERLADIKTAKDASFTIWI